MSKIKKFNLSLVFVACLLCALLCMNAFADEAETELDTAMNEWEKLNAEYEALITDDN